MVKRISPFLLVLLVFAAIGFVFELVRDPVSILITVGMSLLLFFLVNNYLKTGKFFPRFQKASAPKPNTKPTRSHLKKTASPRKPNPFQVIEGNKGKPKNTQKNEEKIYH